MEKKEGQGSSLCYRTGLQYAWPGYLEAVPIAAPLCQQASLTLQAHYSYYSGHHKCARSMNA